MPISSELTNGIKILMANLEFLTTASSIKCVQSSKQLRQWPTTGNGITACFGANLAILCEFSVGPRCRNYLPTLLPSSSWSKCRVSLDFHRYPSQFWRFKYFWFWRPYRYFLLIVGHCRNHFTIHFRPLHGRKLQICRWNFNFVGLIVSAKVFPVSSATSGYRCLMNEMALEHFLLSLCDQKPRFFRWNFDDLSYFRRYRPTS